MQNNNKHQRKNFLLADFFSLATFVALLALWAVFIFIIKNPSAEILLLLGFFSLPVLASGYVLYHRHRRLEEEIYQHELTAKELHHQRNRYSQALEASRLALWEWDLDSDSMFHSNFKEIFGYEENEIPHFMGNLSPFVHPDDFEKLRQRLVDTLKGYSQHFQCRFRIQHKNGHWRWLEDHGEVVTRHAASGRAKKMLGTRRDVTDEQEKDTRLQLAWKIFEASGEAIYIVDASANVIFINQAFSEITGYKADEVLNQSFWDLPFVKTTKHFYEDINRRLTHTGRWEGEIVQTRANNETYPQWLRAIRILNTNEDKYYTIGIFSDLTETQETEDRLNYLVQHDELTGLVNRTKFYTELHKQLAKAKMFKQDFSIMFFDIDRFKAFNSSLGHKLGDSLLQQFANRINKNLADKANLIARMGSNEFALIVKGTTNEAVLLGEELQNLAHKPFRLGSQDVRLTLSVGISNYPKTATEMQPLVNQADQARLSCKAQNGNKIQVYNDSIRQISLELLRLEQDLRNCLDNNELEVYYQPKLSLANNKIVSAEALARWIHPEQGFISPGVFIPLAERTGLIESLGSLILRKACQQIATWHQKGIEIQVAVNIAAQQLTSGKLLNEIKGLLSEYEIPAKLLQLELTESSLMEDTQAAIGVMFNLRSLGITLAIDDFGTGYSSLSYLQRFPLDILKIDRSFIVNDKGTPERASPLTKAIIALGHGLGLKVVAEGVEEESQLQDLTKLNCDYAQGFIISKPVPVAEFEQVLAKYS